MISNNIYVFFPALASISITFYGDFFWLSDFLRLVFSFYYCFFLLVFNLFLLFFIFLRVNFLSLSSVYFLFFSFCVFSLFFSIKKSSCKNIKSTISWFQYYLCIILALPSGHQAKKNICMFAVTRPSLLKSTKPKLFLRQNLQKIIEDL